MRLDCPPHTARRSILVNAQEKTVQIDMGPDEGGITEIETRTIRSSTDFGVFPGGALYEVTGSQPGYSQAITHVDQLKDGQLYATRQDPITKRLERKCCSWGTPLLR